MDTTSVAEIAGGKALGPPTTIDGATIDSRTVSAGSLFVPIVAERDGHEFIADAVAAGAVSYLTQREPDPMVPAVAIRVADTAAALTALGTEVRARISQVVGITGSVGKTSVKDLTAAALATAFRTTASYRSFNNDLGVPLTLVNAPDDTEIAVVEMGARGAGHIAQLCTVARPTIAVVTAVAHAHTELFGTIEDVAEAKAELVVALYADGAAVLNAGDERVLDMARHTDADVVTYGIDEGDVRVTRLTLDGELRPSFRLETPSGAVDLQLAVRGRHNAENAAAAVAVALVAGVTVEQAAAGLVDAELSPLRMDLTRSAAGAIILNDAYNANPASMRAALRSLAEVDATRHTAVLGLMAELGDIAPEEHRAIAALAEELKIRLIAVDAPQYGVDEVVGIDGAMARLGPIGVGDAVLVKGSRVAGLERLAARLLDDPT